MKWFKKTKEEIKEAKKKYSVKEIFGGEILLANFFSRQWLLLLVIFGFIMLFISNRYSMIQKIILTEKLKKELIDSRYDYQVSSAELIRNTRPTAIDRELKKRNIELIDPVEPAFEIQVENYDKEKDAE